LSRNQKERTLTTDDVVPIYSNVFIAIRSVLFMWESQCV